MAVSMLFMTACSKEESAINGGKNTTSATIEDGNTTATTGSTTTTTMGASASSENVTTTGKPTSVTTTGAILTKPTKTGTSAAVYENATDAFVARFEEWLLNLTEYQKATPKVTSVSDGTVTAYTLVGAKNTADYCVHIHSNKNKSIRAVYVTTEAKDYDFMFSVIAYYVYDSLGLTKLDADTFLEQFDAFPDSLTLANQAEGDYRMMCGLPDEFLTFAVLDKSSSGLTTVMLQSQLQQANCSACYADDQRALNYLTLTEKGKDLGLDIAILDRALVNGGNRARLASVMQRAQKGEELTIGFIGGSVTEGAYASDYDKTSYAGLTYGWWEKIFPKATFNYVNAGYGGTSSLFGVHRVQEDLLKHQPDFVVIEFGVNDCDHLYQIEAYANLVHRILSYDSQPAVMLLYVMGDSGNSNQDNQVPVGEHYDLPMISYRDAIWPEVKNGHYSWNDIGADYVHPTDLGHSLIAELMISYLSKTYADLSDISTKVPAVAKPYMPYVYGEATYYDRHNITPLAMNGFREINNKKYSWMGNAKASITFEFVGQQCIVAIPTAYKDSLDVSIRIDGGEPVKLEHFLFHGGAFANYVAFEEQSTAKHTIEIICNSGVLYLSGLFVS